ncbi:metabotropic glutamate receptor 8-like [Physella acuta]|uniref:metabotropic glutamate receptor 8-like n=1 Tax=Physella acuta TaxID=109671 RepID=UPI0027DBB7F5|nr:metabotropic glutamate receptor 8-like [Physella acuta]
MITRRTLYLVFAMVLNTSTSENLQRATYVEHGELMIGALWSISSESETCDGPIINFDGVDSMEALAYGIKKVNEEFSEQLQFKFGFVMMDVCRHKSMAIRQTLRLLEHSGVDYDNITEHKSIDRSFRVIGVIGTEDSITTYAVAPLFGAFNVPILSAYSTADILTSDKRKFSTFVRMVPKNSFQIDAMVDFFIQNDWRFVAVIFEYGLYGESSFKFFRQRALQRHICIAKVVAVTATSHFEKVVDYFLTKVGSRVLVTFVTQRCISKLSNAIIKLGADQRLIVVTTENWYNLLMTGGPKGAVIFVPPFLGITGFQEHYANLGMNHNNPWFIQALHDIHNCTDDICAEQLTKLRLHSFVRIRELVDGVKVLVVSLVKMLSEKCPGLVGRPAVQCFYKNYRSYNSYVKKTEFVGSSGTLFFNQQGDRYSDIIIHQMLNTEEKYKAIVGFYSTLNRMTVLLDPINWDHYIFNKSEVYIEHHCQKPCEPNKYKYPVIRCCWKCRSCQDNEVVTGNKTSCEVCPDLHWPGYTNGTRDKCLPIPVEIPSLSSPMSATLIVLSGSGATFAVWLLVFALVKRINTKDTELLTFRIVEIVCAVWGYVTVPLFVEQATAVQCYAWFINFALSFNILYTTITLKAYTKYIRSRMPSDKKARRKTLNLFLTILLCQFLQTMMFNQIGNWKPITAEAYQPTKSIQVAQWACYFNEFYIYMFLGLTFVLLTVSFMLCFETTDSNRECRRETKYTIIGISISMIIWLAFIIGYVITNERLLKLYYISITSLANHTTALTPIMAHVGRYFYVHYKAKQTFIRVLNNASEVAKQPPLDKTKLEVTLQPRITDPHSSECSRVEKVEEASS